MSYVLIFQALRSSNCVRLLLLRRHILVAFNFPVLKPFGTPFIVFHVPLSSSPQAINTISFPSDAFMHLAAHGNKKQARREIAPPQYVVKINSHKLF